ncbi:MAG: InlB B-repeat-containing protein [Eggerthellaceae bacterium]|nr:InlB B-repeat-containing protein [Eggerthellaceae bacterium]
MQKGLVNRIMDGVKTPEGKVIAILLVICLSLMTWNVAAISWAVAGDAAAEAAAQEEAAKKAAEEEAEANKPKVEVAKQPVPQEQDALAIQLSGDEEEAPVEQQVSEQSVVEDEAAQVEGPEAETSQESGQDSNVVDEQEGEPEAGESTEAEQPEETADEGQDVLFTGDETNETVENGDEAAESTFLVTGDEQEDEAEKAKDMPAQTFKGSANGVTVSVRAPEGAFPAGTQMHVSPVSAAQVIDAVEDAVNASAVAVKAVDITFTYTDENGVSHEVEPATDIQVTMAASDIAAANGSDEQDVAVVHVADGGAADVVGSGASGTAQNSISFTSDEFSVYAIVIIEGEAPEVEQPAEDEEAVLIDEVELIASYRSTYRFFLTDAAGSTSEYLVNGEPATQIVKEGDTLVRPPVPELAEHEEFSGWYVRGTSDAVQFGKVETIERNATIDVVGEINTVFYATLMNGRAGADAEWPVLTNVKATAEKGAAEAVAAVGVHSATSVNDDERFLGWTEDPAATEVQFPAGENLTLSDDTTLYPVFGKAYWLYFDENDGGAGGGASYTAPEYVGFDESPTRPADPQRAGYNFTGWYADAACTQTFDFTRAYNTKTTAYAGWKKASAAYTVIFWQQRVSDDKDAADADKTYDYKESAQRSSYTDEVVVPTDADLAKKYQGFHLNSAKTDSQATVAADGSTVLNVYYDRDLITMTFKGIGETGYTYTSTTSTSGTQYGYVNGEYVELSRTSQTAYSYYYETGSWLWKTEVTYTGTRYTKKGNTYTPTDSTNTSTTYYGLVDGSYVQLKGKTATTYTYTYNGAPYDGVRYTRGSQEARLIISGLYGQTLSRYGYSWPEGTWKYSSSGMTFLGEFILPDSDGYMTSITFETNGAVGGTFNFYLQNADGSYPEEPSDRGYASSSSGKFTFTEKYNGFKVAEYQSNNSSGTSGSWSTAKSGNNANYSSPLGIRYQRQSYDIDFRNGSSGSIGTVSRLFEQSLSGVQAPAAPAFPGNANEASMHEFVGWFADPECTTYVSFGNPISDDLRAELESDWNVHSFTTYEAMPANNLVVYAGWMKKWFHVTLDEAGGTLPQGQVDDFWVQYGDAIAGSSLMQAVREGYTLTGWNVDAADGVPWNFDAGVQGDLHLVARWTTGEDVSVVYDANEGEGAPSDYALYTDGAKVTAKDAPTPPQGKVFVGWRVVRVDGKQGALCYPGQTFTVNQDCIVRGEQGSSVHLIAEYVTYDVTAQISYSPNGGNGTIPSQTIPVNKTSTLSLGDELSREGYTLVGWSLSPGDDNRVSFKLGGAVTVDKVDEESNVLYAVWAKNVTITATGANARVAYDGKAKVNDEPAMSFTVAGEKVDELPEGISYSISGRASGVNAGTYDDELSVSVGSYDTNRYYVTTHASNGRLTVTKPTVNLTVTGHVSSVPYDAQEHSVSGYDVMADNVAFEVADLQFSGVAEAARTDAGATEMGLEASQFSLADTSNFELGEVTVVDGRQEVTPAKVQVNIVGATGTVTYSGAEQSVEGYTATPSDTAYTEADFTFTGNAKAAGTQAGVYTMGLDASQFTNKNDNYDPTFNIVTDGSLTITPIDEVVVTITGDGKIATYDGNEHAASGYTFTASDPAYTEADFAFTGSAEVAATDAGYAPMGLSPEQFENKNESFAKVTFVVTDGYVDIAKAQAIVTIKGDFPEAVTYDGQEHVAEGYTAISSSPAFDVERDLVAKKDASQMRVAKTDAGTYAMGLTEADFANSNSGNVDVAFVVQDGGLVINRITETVVVTVVGAIEAVDYDGVEHSASGFTVQASNPLYRTQADETGVLDYAYSGSSAVKGTNAGTYPMGLARSGFANLNQNFTDVKFEVTDGELTIRKLSVNVAITGNSATREYTGAEQSVEGFDVKCSSELYTRDDFTVNGEVKAARTDAGTTAMGLSHDRLVNLNNNFDVVFSVTDGSLTITPVQKMVVVSVKGNSQTLVYNGTSQKVEGYTVTGISDARYKESYFAFDGSEVASGIDVGSYPMSLAAEQFKNLSDNFAWVEFLVQDGGLEIVPADVTVKVVGQQVTTVYDGQEHVASGFTTFESGSSLYDAASWTTFASAGGEEEQMPSVALVDAGTENMGLTSERFENTNPNFNVTYDVTDGFVTVLPLKVGVSVDGHVGVAPYDGKAHVVEGWDAQADSELFDVADITFTGKASASQTDVGTAYMSLAADQFGCDNENFDVAFAVASDGYSQVTPADEVVVTIIGHNATGAYDGEAHAVSGYDVLISSDVYTEADFTGPEQQAATASQTDAGTAYMGLSADQFANANANFSKVTFEVTDGYQTVTKRPVVVAVTGNTAVHDYDACEHVAEGFEVDIQDDLYTTDDFTAPDRAKASVALVHAGTKAMGLSADQFTNKNDNFAPVFTVTDGWVSVSPIAVTVQIEGACAENDYDALEHVVSGYTARASVNEGLAEGSQPLFDIAANVTFTGEARAARLKAGTTKMGLSAEMFEVADNPDFSSVTFDVADGYQIIRPVRVEVAITGATSTVAFDGQEHAVDGYDIVADVNRGRADDRLVFDPSLVRYEGTPHAARTDAGTTEMGLSADKFTCSDTVNYSAVTFTVTDGYQTVEPIAATVSIVGARSTADYDGDAHSVEGYTASITPSLYTEADFVFSGEAVAARTDAGTTYMGLSADQFANTNANFSDVVFDVVDGYQTVTKRSVAVSIVGEKLSAPYSGKEQSVEGFKASTADSLYDVDEFVQFAGEAVARGTDAGSYPMKLSVGQFANTSNNFDVAFDVVDGGLTIVSADQVIVTVTGKRASGTYTGRPLTATGYDVSISDERYKAEDFSFSGTATATRTDAGTTQMGLAASQFTNLDPVNFPDVVFVVEDGFVEVARATANVNVKGHTDQVVYDRAAHTVSGYDVTIESSTGAYGESDFELAADADPSVTGTDAGEYPMGLTEGTFGPGAATSQFANTNQNYDVVFQVVDGRLTVTKQKAVVTIAGAVLNVAYDREEHVVSGYTVQSSNPAFDVETDLVARVAPDDAKAAGVNAGTYAMGLVEGDFQNANKANVDVELRLTDGRLVISPVTNRVVVNIVGDAKTFAYDGLEHAASGFEVSANNALYRVDASEGATDFSFTDDAAVKSTNAGFFAMGISADDFQNANPNFENVTFKVTDGSLRINPAQVKVSVAGGVLETVYSGRTQAAEGYTLSSDSELYRQDDVAFSGNATVTAVDAGTYAMGLTSDQFANSNPNFNVTFEVKDGCLSIAPLEVNVSVIGHTGVNAYDGTEHSTSGYDVEASSPLYKASFLAHDGVAYAARTDAGTTDMGLTSDQFANSNPNFSVTAINVTDGYQQVTPADEVVVTITGHVVKADYDGLEHVARGYDVAISNPLYKAADFIFTGEAQAALTDAGTASMGLTAEQFSNINTNFENVEFKVEDGSVTVNPITAVVTIRGVNSTTTYDSTEHEVEGYTATSSSPLYAVGADAADFTFTGEAKAARTDAGTTYMGLAADQFANDNPNFENVTFRVVDGYQTVEPATAQVVITGHSAVCDYDGAEHSVEGFDAEISDELYNEDDFTFTGEAKAARTDAGTTHMGLAPEQFANANPNFANVTFRVVDGFQTVVPINATVTIVGATTTVDYDGATHMARGFTATADVNGSAGEAASAARPLYDVVNDVRFDGKAQAERADAGTTYMGLAPEQFANVNPNFADVTFVVADGYARVNPLVVKVSIAGATATKSYSGSEQKVEGYIASADTSLYDVDANVGFAGDATVQGTNAGLYPMGLSPADFTNGNENFDVSFLVTDGWLSIAPAGQVVVNVVGNSATGTYTGQALEAQGYTLQFSDWRYTASNITFTGDAKVSRTDAGRESMGLAADQFANDDRVNFPDVVFAVADGFVEVAPATAVVTVEGSRLSTTYDGSEHGVEGYDTSITSSTGLYAESNFHLAEGVGASAAGTNAGTYPMGLAEGTFGPGESGPFVNDDANYDVTFIVSDGWLAIGKARATVTVTGKTLACSYDGAEHAAVGYTAQSSNALYRVEPVEADEAAGTPAAGADFAYSGPLAASGVDAGSYPMCLDSAQFENVNPNFDDVEFIVVDGGLTIAPAAVTVTIVGNTATRSYTGEEQQVEGYRLTTTNSLYNSDYVLFEGEATARGENARARYAMGLSAEQFANVNPNFDVAFEVQDGWLAISPIDAVVTITGNHDAVTYDGAEHSAKGYEAHFSTPLYTADDFEFAGTSEVARTDAGTSYMGLAPEQFANVNPNFDHVEFRVADGYLTIVPAGDVVVTITGRNGLFSYDGAEHLAEGFDAEISDPLYTADDFAFAGGASAARTDAGTSYMGLVANQFSNTNPNFENVTFKVVDGYLTVAPINVSVSVTGSIDKATYDGIEHSVSGFTATSSTPLYTASDFVFTGTSEVARTDAGTSYMGLAPDQFANANPNFAEVMFSVVDGYQTVIPTTAQVVIVGHSTTATYDGEAHVAEGYEANISGSLYTADDFTFLGSDKVVAVGAGTYPMGLSADQFANTNPNFENVVFSVTDGGLRVDPLAVQVRVVGTRAAVSYTGSEQSVEGYEASADSELYDVARGVAFSGAARASGVRAGDYPMGLAASQFANTDPNFDVSFDVADGQLSIAPAGGVVVYITGHEASRVYDGEEFVVEGYDVQASDELYSSSNIEFTGEARAALTDAGTAEMGLAAEQFANTNPDFSDVRFVVADGRARVTPAPATVEVAGGVAEVEYDGTEQRVEGFELSSGSALYDLGSVAFSGEAAAARTDVGTTNMGLSADQFANTDPNFDVSFEVADGHLRVTPVAERVVVRIAGATASGTYCGTERSVSGYEVLEVSNPLYAPSDVALVGADRAAGTNVGTYPMGLSAGSFANQNANFADVAFEVEDGSLQITPAAVTVSVEGAHDALVYDGKEHAVSGYALAASSDLYDARASTSFTPASGAVLVGGEVAAVRTQAGTTNMGLAAEQFANTDPNFDVEYVVSDGYLSIAPAGGVVVRITGHTAEAVYDGDEHAAEGYDFEASDPLYTADDFAFTGGASAARTDAGTSYMGLSPEQFSNASGDFEDVVFDVVDGYVAVGRASATVTVKGNTATAVYDGAEHSVSGYTATSSTPLYAVEGDAAGFEFTGSAAAARTDVGTTNMGLAASQFANADPNFEGVVFEVEDGYQRITPNGEVVVKVAGHSDEAVYDGEEHSVSGYDFEASNPLYTADDFAFTGEAKAARTDAGTTPMGLSADQFANTNPNFENVVFEVADGGLKVNPVRVTVYVAGSSAEIDYDGEEHEISGYELSLGEPVGMRVASDATSRYDLSSVSYTGNAKAARTDVGSTPLVFEAGDFANSDTNYDVTFAIADGNLKVNAIPATVHIAGNVEAAEYDGTEHIAKGYKVKSVSSVGNLYTEDDFAFSGEAAAARTDVGTTNMGLSADQFANTNPNFNNVTFAIADGSIQVTKRSVQLVSASDSKVYDGAPLVRHEVEGDEGFVEGENVGYFFSGSQTEVGTSENTFSYVRTDALENNYNVSESFGTLTVTESPSGAEQVEPDAGQLAYTLTIEYRYENGDQAASAHVEQLAEGVRFEVVSPEINGYQPDYRSLVGAMPAGDLKIVVIYTAARPVQAAQPAKATEPASSGGTPEVSERDTAPVFSRMGEVVVDDGVPTVRTIEDDEGTALTDGSEGSWSLFDVVATVLAVLVALVLAVGLFGRKRRDGDDGNGPDGEDAALRVAEHETAADNERNDDARAFDRHRGLRILALAIGVVAIVLLFVTQDFTQTMALFDRWSVLFAIICIAQIVVAFLARKKRKDDDGEGDEEGAGSAQVQAA